MEHAVWIASLDELPESEEVTRVYFGEECCQNRLLEPVSAARMAGNISKSGKSFTLVTPFLTNDGIERAVRLIDAMKAEIGSFEVVCNDWGLLKILVDRGDCIPVIGRLLSRQDTDPRLAAMYDTDFQSKFERNVFHWDGTAALLKHRLPSELLRSHLQKCSLDCDAVYSFLDGYNIRRFEVSNIPQGLKLNPPEGWNVSLHLPYVLLSISRDCTAPPFGNKISRACNVYCDYNGMKEWNHPSFRVSLITRHNGIYYVNTNGPDEIALLGIDRIVTSNWG